MKVLFWSLALAAFTSQTTKLASFQTDTAPDAGTSFSFRNARVSEVAYLDHLGRFFVRGTDGGFVRCLEGEVIAAELMSFPGREPGRAILSCVASGRTVGRLYVLPDAGTYWVGMPCAPFGPLGTPIGP